MIKICTYLFILLSALNFSLASNIIPSNERIEKFVSEQGFYQNTINAIASDINGYIWIATPNGLVRYDGYSFEYFYHDPENTESIPNNFISCLLKDSDGKLWIGTKQEICLYLSEKEQFILIQSTDRIISFIKEDPQKRTWTGNGSTLCVFKTDNNLPKTVAKAAEIVLDKELSGNKIVDIEFISDSVLILATTLKLYKLTMANSEKHSVKIMELAFEAKQNVIGKIIKVENTIWIGTDKGLYQTVLENNRLIIAGSYFDSNKGGEHKQCSVLSLFMDERKDLWIGTAQDGIYKYNRDNYDFISFKYDAKNEFGLTSNRINCLYEDDFGVMWIGTAQGGLNKLDKNQKPFQNYSHNPYDNQSLSDNLITDISEDREGRIWISFFENTICRTFEKVDLAEGRRFRFERLEKQLKELKHHWVVCLFQDFKGFWWIGTDRGIYLYDEVHDKVRQIQIIDGGQPVTTVHSRVITQIDPNHILIGGIQIYLLKNPWKDILADKPVQISSNILNLENDNFVNDFVLDAFGNYWIATRNGIYQLALEQEELVIKNHLTTSPNKDSLQLSHNNIFSIHENLNKDIWLGTFGGGLMRIQLNPAGRPEKIKSYHKKDGLPDEAIYGILEDEKGIFWISTDMGICQFDPVTEKFDVFDVNDGILNNNFRQSAYLKTKSGIMLMGGLNGLTVFNPSQIKKNQIPTRVLLSRLKINNQAIIAGKEFNKKIILERSISDTKKLVLDYRNRNISLDVIVQHYSAPKKNQLSYMLEGVNKDWIEIKEGKTTASYNLSSGTYRFMYKGANGDGVWSEKTGELIIEVLAPWYLRWWALMVWGLIILFVVYEIFSYLVRMEKLKQKLKFEQLDKERVHEMDQAKLQFFTNISHEFKTPLSLIIGPIEKIAAQNKRKEDQKYYSIIQHNILRLQRLIEQLISYRKAETGHLELCYSKITLGNFIYPILEAFEENAKMTNINFFYKVHSPNQEVVLDVDKTECILLNLFSNAVKYTASDANISIKAGFHEEGDSELLYIEVMDNGIGIPPEKINRIFDRFYRGVDDQGHWSGTGIGLALCKSLIDLMKGTITVESVPKEKTIFKIYLPFDQNLNAVTDNKLSEHRKIVTDWIPSELGQITEPVPDLNLPALLIIDDEPDIRTFLYETFKKQYKITLSENGEDGLKKVKENQPHLVICDVIMPKLNGYEVCKSIKSNPDTCHIPVILLTAIDDDAKKIEGLEFGADDFITKPFSIRHLELRIKRLLENKQRIIEYFSRSSVIPASDLNMAEKDRLFLEKIIASIEKNISDSAFGVEELARDVGMSTSHFYRKLKQLTGQLPNVYLRNFRLQRAAELLRANKGLTAIEIMFEIGIESPSYFSTSFKKLHGISPSEFIN